VVAGVLLLTGAARGEEPGRSSIWIAIEGGGADTLGMAGWHVGTTIPFRVDVGLRLSEHVWLAPFVSAAWVGGETFSSSFPVSDGFRLLAGGELQVHSAAAQETIDVFGGLGLAFERLVAHGRGDVCGHCEPATQSLIGNGANLELRVGILVRFASFLLIGPYVGAQLSWMPGLKLTQYVPPDQVAGPGGTTATEVDNVQLWIDFGLRMVVLF
jgi:hypothetical protein